MLSFYHEYYDISYWGVTIMMSMFVFIFANLGNAPGIMHGQYKLFLEINPISCYSHPIIFLRDRNRHGRRQ